MKFTIKVPATSANLGPGFDALGLALNLWNETMIAPAREFAVKINGEGANRLSPGKNNLIIRTAQRLAERAGKTLPPFHAECINHIPLSSGLGSSAATILTGLLTGNALLENPLSNEEILNLASEIEGHPDNAAPAVLGGLVVSTVEAGKVIARPIPIGMDVCITIALPDFYITTKQARASLPKKISMKNAVYNLSRAVLVTEAFRTGDLSLLGKAMTDRLHQPYRLKLIPGAQSAIQAAQEAGAAAVALSGAGPSLIAFSKMNNLIGNVGRKIKETEPKAMISGVQEEMIGLSMRRAFEAAGLSVRIFHLWISSQGAQVQTE